MMRSENGKATADVAIIGGGVIGLACAWQLARRGTNVQLFERGPIGHEASHAAAGMLAPQCEAAVHPPTSCAESVARAAFFELCLQSHAAYPRFCDELQNVSNCDVELSLHGAKGSDWRTPGILFAGKPDDPAFAGFADQREEGMGVEPSQWPNHRAVWLPSEGQVENRKLVAALKVACERAGVVMHERTPMTIEAARELAASVLICGGAWSTQVAQWLPPIRPVNGEIVALRSHFELEHILYSREVYLVPRRDGRVLVGATMAERDYDKIPTRAARDYLLHAARDLLPIDDWEIEDHWAGLRPATPDGLPILGSTPLENVFVATGHFRNGILLTPITSQLLADCILEGKAPPSDFSLDRFAGGVLAECA